MRKTLKNFVNKSALWILCAAVLMTVTHGKSYALDYDWRDPLSVPGILDVPAWTGVLMQGFALTASLLLSSPESHVENVPGTFRFGSHYYYSRAGYYQGYHHHHTDVFEGSAGFGYFLRDWLAVGGDFYAVKLRDDRLSTGGIGGKYFIRWHLVRKRKWSAYYENGLGILLTHEDFPPGGTKVNFTPAYGVGFTYKMADHAHMILCFRHYHISNGGLVAGENRNPGFDANGIYSGYHFQF
ncbi:acyloxyacyl hydrolase [bacterium]|nr:acyloxyacyl hydrolase [bacterium]